MISSHTMNHPSKTGHSESTSGDQMRVDTSLSHTSMWQQLVVELYFKETWSSQSSRRLEKQSGLFWPKRTWCQEQQTLPSWEKHKRKACSGANWPLFTFLTTLICLHKHSRQAQMKAPMVKNTGNPALIKVVAKMLFTEKTPKSAVQKTLQLSLETAQLSTKQAAQDMSWPWPKTSLGCWQVRREHGEETDFLKIFRSRSKIDSLSKPRPSLLSNSILLTFFVVFFKFAGLVYASLVISACMAQKCLQHEAAAPQGTKIMC